MSGSNHQITEANNKVTIYGNWAEFPSWCWVRSVEGALQLVDQRLPRRSPGGSLGIARIYVIAWNECVHRVHQSSTEQR